jgi:CBS domain-containing protein
MLVRDRMVTPPHTVRPDVPYYKALQIMQACNVDYLPVVDESGALQGAVSEDLLTLAAARYLDSCIEVGDVAAPTETTLSPDTPLDVAARVLIGTRGRALAVVERGQVVGTLAFRDVMSAWLESRSGDASRESMPDSPFLVGARAPSQGVRPRA